MAILSGRSGFDTKDFPRIARGINRVDFLHPDDHFGRFGLTLIKPLYTQLYSNPYTEVITETEVRILEWWAASIRATIPRIVAAKSPRPEILIYTDAATGKLGTHPAIIAAVVIEPMLLSSDGYFAAALTEKPTPSGKRFPRQPHTFTAAKSWMSRPLFST